MKEEDLTVLKAAARWENRGQVVRMTLKHGEILMAKIISLPCDCENCSDTNVICEFVSSSVPERIFQWERDRIKKNVGGWGVPMELIERVESVEGER